MWIMWGLVESSRVDAEECHIFVWGAFFQYVELPKIEWYLIVYSNDYIISFSATSCPISAITVYGRTVYSVILSSGW